MYARSIINTSNVENKEYVEKLPPARVAPASSDLDGTLYSGERPLPQLPLAAARGAGREPARAPRTAVVGPLSRWSRMSRAVERRNGNLSGSAVTSAARREIRGSRGQI
jgi:hypothetical protein